MKYGFLISSFNNFNLKTQSHWTAVFWFGVTYQLFPKTSHSNFKSFFSSSVKESWKEDKENGIELSFCTPVGLTPFTAITVLLFEDVELKDAESFIFFVEGSLVFPWELENISTSVRWRLTWVDATAVLTDVGAVDPSVSSFAETPHEGSKSSR